MLFSRKDLFTIIAPLMVEQLLSITIGMLDTVMVASAGQAAVSGVSLVDSLNLLLIYIFSALATGGAVISSQFLGAKNFIAARKSAKQLIYSVFSVSFVIMLIAVIFRVPLLRLIFGEINADIMENAKIYFLFTAISYPFLALYNAGAALFRSMGNSKISMRASLLMNGINVAGNAILIFIFKMGAAGAAIATLFSRIIGAFLMLILLHDKHNTIYIEKIFSYKPDFTIIKNILKIGIPNGLENSMFQFGKVLTQSLIASFGAVAIGANAAAGSLSSIQYVCGTAISLSMVAIVGRCIGAGELKQAKKYTITLLSIAYTAIFLVALFSTIFINNLVGLYNLDAASSKQAVELMIYHGICVCTIWPSAFTLPNAFRAASDVKYPLLISMISMWVFRVGFSFVLGKFMGLGVMGVWIAMTIDWLFRAVLFIIRFIRGKWMEKYKPIRA